MTELGTPIDFKGWIDANRDRLRPPVGNAELWPGREFTVMVVGGPNARTDYHINEGEEFFYQLEGDIVLRTLDESGVRRDLTVRQGEVYLLPPRVPHSPQRPAGSVGLVIERRRLPHERDGFLWVCDGCGAKLHEEFIELRDIVVDLPNVFKRFFDDPFHTTCRSCGLNHSPRVAP
ncbi:MAG: 3-hydroxyanthranilate 3,4-dioxygenase [Myxococcales bacterium]|nr:3-hydroxyanthranilate 3,4-dioxygenase [Myxococcales bacterium]